MPSEFLLAEAFFLRLLDMTIQDITSITATTAIPVKSTLIIAASALPEEFFLAVTKLPSEYSGVKSITCPAIGNHHSGQTEISIPEMEITNILS